MRRNSLGHDLRLVAAVAVGFAVLFAGYWVAKAVWTVRAFESYNPGRSPFNDVSHPLAGRYRVDLAPATARPRTMFKEARDLGDRPQPPELVVPTSGTEQISLYALVGMLIAARIDASAGRAPTTEGADEPGGRFVLIDTATDSQASFPTLDALHGALRARSVDPATLRWLVPRP